jgi:hypothetical protein
MIEKNFLNTVEIPAVMPVEIKIRVYRGLFETKFVDRDEQPVYVLEKRESTDIKHDLYEAFTDGLYIALLSIDDEKQAEDFINRHPYFCISFPDDFGHEKTVRVISKRDYLRLMLDNIYEFKAVSDIYKGVHIIENEPTNTSALLSTTRLLASDRHLGLNPELKEQLNLMLDNFGYTLEELSNWVDSAVYGLICLLEKRTKMINLAPSLFKPNLEFCCPSLLSAMYKKMLISAYNHEEYRQCANKHCNNYFKVGNRTTQKYCEKHLEARRRKQRKYLEKQNQIEL